MSRFRRFSLRQLLLVVGLFALLFAIIAALNQRFSISHHDSALAISPNGRTLAIGISSLPVPRHAQNVFLVDMDTQKRTALLVRALWVHDVAFSPSPDYSLRCLSF